MATATEVEKVTKNNGKKNQAKLEVQKSGYSQVYGEYIQRIEKKAYELYEKRGCEDGRDQEDWLEAQKIVEAEMIAGK